MMWSSGVGATLWGWALWCVGMLAFGGALIGGLWYLLTREIRREPSASERSAEQARGAVPAPASVGDRR